MEFKKEDVLIVDENKEKLINVIYPCLKKDNEQGTSECNKRWIESLSDCA